MFTAALFIIAKNSKRPKCSSIRECFNKIWYIHTMVYCSAKKSNKLLIYATIWMDLKGIILSKKRQPQKVTVCMTFFI